jgi:hypothetical protein
MMKNISIFFFFYCICILSTFATTSKWDGKSSDTSWYDESATEYHLSSAAQFRGLADLVSYNNCSFENKTIYLDCDIDLDSHPWSPIGLHSGKPFSGVFDGQSHSITNLLIDTQKFDYPDMKDNVGLFGYAVSATIKQISVQGDIEVYSGKYIGGIAAFIKTIEDIYSDIKIVLHNSVSSSYIGSVLGSAENASRVYCTGEISCDYNSIGLNAGCYVGGFAGRCTSITECHSNIYLSLNIIGMSSENIGGISGASTDISNALFTGRISINNYNCSNDMFMPNTGGICGGLYSTGDHLISAPESMTYGRGFATAKSVVVPSTSNAQITDTYYISTWATNNEKFGVATTQQNLKSGNTLSNFDTNIWNFQTNEYPSLKSLEKLMPKPTYTVSYYVDGILYQVDTYKNEESVIPPTDPVKEGYTFNGWDYIPPFIYGNSYIVNGSFSINKYTITYIIEDNVFKTEELEYDTYINLPTVFPLKKGYLFNWGNYPSKVPAYDVTINGYYTEDTYEFVDLGLPSGLLWATKNIGAATPEDYGYYFAWGETDIKESYYWGTYRYCNGSPVTLTKYCNSYEYGQVDNKNTLDEEDDAAIQNWGKPWRTPTLSETQELINNCSWNYTSKNGIYGYTVTGPNGNSFFLPAAGVKQYKTTFYSVTNACIQSATIFNASNGEPSSASVLYIENGTPHYWYGWNRCWGYTVRPVTSTDPSEIKNIPVDVSQDIIGIYDLQGHRLNEPTKGVYIIKYKNGNTKKIINW